MKRLFVLISISLTVFTVFKCSAQDVLLKINLRGVYESKITLLPLIGPKALQPLVEKDNIKEGEIVTLSVSNSQLPAEFVLRFDYKEKETSAPYPAEKRIVINNQNLELWVNPPYCNNNDSTWFQKEERENRLIVSFFKGNNRRKEKIMLLQNFLLNYDNIQSKFYQLGIVEYEKQRNNYNNWIIAQSKENSNLFVSHTFRFQYVPLIDFKGNEEVRRQHITEHYFDGIDFSDTLLVRTSGLKEWITSYVNIFGAISNNESMRDSLVILAGKNAIEKAKVGHPKVYGWMVDYFYAGYEAFGIKKGTVMLQQYLDNPNCLTSKKQQIIKRLEGMAKLVVGTQAPDFRLNCIDGSAFDFHAFKGTSKYKLLLFWSADCAHCQQLVSRIKSWYNETGNKEKLDIVAVSLDDTETEVPKWEKATVDLPEWKHLRAKGGVNSVVANDYAILSTPVMFLIDSFTNIIIAVPDTLEQLMVALEK
ncbi:MAG: thioredoxin family protein [Prolixibacteraceae bacterium]